MTTSAKFTLPLRRTTRQRVQLYELDQDGNGGLRESKRRKVQVDENEPTVKPTLNVEPTSSSAKPHQSLQESIKTEPEPESLVAIQDVKPPTPTKSKSTSHGLQLSLAKPHPAPPRWAEQYALIERMRSKIIAPVDTLGCDAPSRDRTTDPKTVRFHILISLMLSSQTKDAVTAAAIENLHQALSAPTPSLTDSSDSTSTIPGPGLTAQSLALAPISLIESCIAKVGFWRRKAGYIKSAAERIVLGGLDDGEDQVPGYELDVTTRKDETATETVATVTGVDEALQPEPGDIPRTLGGLCKLKGVGPKMAFLALQCAWNINAGVGVDVHVHRITNRLGWHKPKTTSAEQTRLNLQSWLPPHLYKPINHVLVGFGQTICLPVGPRCDVCLLAKDKMCPSRVVNVNTKGRKVLDYDFQVVPNVGEVNQDDSVIGSDAMAKVKIEFEGADTANGEANEEAETLRSIKEESNVIPETEHTDTVDSVKSEVKLEPVG